MVVEFWYSDNLSDESGGFSQPSQSTGSCTGDPLFPCESGCWFLFTHAGCKQSSDCKHCHHDACCAIADLQRKDLRRQHSRLRPSKKKRERLSRLTAMQGHNDISFHNSLARGEDRWETSHFNTPSNSWNTEFPVTSIAEDESGPHFTLEDLQDLLDLIQSTL